MKKILGISLLVLVLIFGFAGCGTSDDGDDGSNGGDDTATVSTNYEKYSQISLGMTYEEVCDIVGGEGTAVEEPEDGLEEYTWDGEVTEKRDRTFMQLGFKDGALVKKIQSGLLTETTFTDGDPVIDSEKLAGIEIGMSVSDVETLMGGAGKLSSEILLDDGRTQTESMYIGSGVNESAYVVITYVDDVVTDVYQNGVVEE